MANLKSLLKNKYVLYAVSALAVINVLGYLSIGSMECLGVFALTAFVVQQYNKNMVVCLLAAIFAANVVFGCGRIKENFVEGVGSGKTLPEAAKDCLDDGTCAEAGYDCVADKCVKAAATAAGEETKKAVEEAGASEESSTLAGKKAAQGTLQKITTLGG